MGQGPVKRRTTSIPKQHSSTVHRSVSFAGPNKENSSSGKRSLPSRANSILTTKSTSMYSGALNQQEVMAGYGMGMAVTRKESVGGLFSAVTGEG
jgi:hypothetical protein